jgi:hypothetical protein
MTWPSHLPWLDHSNYVWRGVLGTPATNRPIAKTPSDYDDGEIGGMMIDRGNRSTRRKPAPVSLCPIQIPCRTGTRDATVGRPRLTAWAMARPCIYWSWNCKLAIKQIIRPFFCIFSSLVAVRCNLIFPLSDCVRKCNRECFNDDSRVSFPEKRPLIRALQYFMSLPFF